MFGDCRRTSHRTRTPHALTMVKETLCGEGFRNMVVERRRKWEFRLNNQTDTSLRWWCLAAGMVLGGWPSDVSGKWEFSLNDQTYLKDLVGVDCFRMMGVERLRKRDFRQNESFSER